MATQTNILIVDDSEDDAVLLSALLSREMPGLYFERVDSAVNLRSALRTRIWDMVICDHSMPSFDSKAALEIVRSSGVDLPFVIYSGHYSESQGVEAMQLGARDFVEKGNPARILPVVRRELSTIHLKREKEFAEQRAEEVSRYDSLTRLPNRLFMRELCDQALDEARNAGKKIVLIYVDLDRFMRINESYSYAIGDALLQAVATRLKSVAGGAVVSRIGTDEFALLVEGITTERGALRFADRLLARMAEPFFVGTQDFFLSASLGLCIGPDHALDTTTLLKNAESAMRSAKRDGGARYALYSDALNQGTSRQVRLEQALRHAIELDQLQVAYQPFFDLKTGRITGTEALLRWRHPEFGHVSPVEFIPIAEESNQILLIGEWVLRAACLQTRLWHDAGFRDMAVAVNFTSTQFRQDNLVQRILPMIAATGLPASHLQIEITESIAMKDAESTIATLRALQAAGMKLSIDDFGTGYSSLAYLKRFPIQVLKIDKTFVRDVHRDAENQAIVRAVIALAQALRLKTLAEGVECAEEMEFLRAEGCDRIQGYYFAKPSTDPAVIEALLRQYNQQPVAIA